MEEEERPRAGTGRMSYIVNRLLPQEELVKGDEVLHLK